MPKNIIKSAFQIIVLHPEDVDVTAMSLEDLAYEMDNGMCVGQFRHIGSSTRLHPDVLESELNELGNDGTFFDDGDDE